MGETCTSTALGEDERCIHNLVGKHRWKRPLGKRWHQCGDNMNTDLNEEG
jgi:hypothetical protein